MKQMTLPNAACDTADSPLSSLLGETSFETGGEAYALARRGVCALLTRQHEVVRSEVDADADACDHNARIDRSTVDLLIAAIDDRLSCQVNAILHAKPFQQLESAWRGLKFLVDRVDFRENTRVEVLHATKDELAEDFDDSTEVTTSALYRTVYANEYGVFGGQPFGAIVANYDFAPSARDMSLLKSCSSVAAMAHAPFLANAAPRFFGGDSFSSLAELPDLQAQFEGPQYTEWNAFRDSEDSRYAALCVPRFLLRLPYGGDTRPVKAFAFEEDVYNQHDAYLWGYASMALASRVADSFANYRWCPNIVGPIAGGNVDSLPLHHFPMLGEVQTKIPTEVLLTERREYELAQQGFVGMTYRKDSNSACFFSANTPQRPRTYGSDEAGRQKEANHRLGTQLPYIFIVTRLAHYLKVLQREQIGSSKERSELERELNQWILQYVADMDNPAPGVRSRRPLRKAQIKVLDVEGEPGWYRCHLDVQPHMKYMGAAFTLSLVGRLDKSRS